MTARRGRGGRGPESREPGLWEAGQAEGLRRPELG